MALTRRSFLRSGGVAVVGLGTGLVTVPGFLARAAGRTRGRGKVLVVVFQRGAADGLNMVVPFGEKAYYRTRPTIAIAPPRAGKAGSAIDLDGFFGLHPALAPFKALYDDRALAVVHAAGSPDATRSHFDAQDFMESGTPGVKSTRDGWLNRYLRQHAREHARGFRAVSMTTELPRILGGAAPALAIPALSRFAIGAGGGGTGEAIEELYRASSDPILSGAAREAFEALDLLRAARASKRSPENDAVYPPGPFGRSLRQVAQLVKAEVGLEVAFVETRGWDHHVNEGGAEGQLARLLEPFAAGIAALVRDLGSRMGDVVLVTLSEFGRTVRENGSRGTDHGHGNCIFVLGGPVAGGEVRGPWPGLEGERLHEGRDLALTTDFRDVLGEVLVRHLGLDDLGPVFPGYDASSGRFRGVIRRSGPA